MADVIVKTRTTRNTWSGQAGEQTIHHLNSSRDGLRIIVFRWLEDGPQGDAGQITVRLVRGNAYTRPDRFVEYEAHEVAAGPGEDEAVAALVARLSEAA